MEPLLFIVTIVMQVLGFAGGGGSSSNYSSGSSSRSSGWSSSSSGWSSSGGSSRGHGDSTLNLIIFLIFILTLAILLVISKKRAKDNSKPTSRPLTADEQAQAMTLLSQADHNQTEREKQIHEMAEKIFVEYQQDWSAMNLANTRNYATERYATHAELLLAALGNLRRKNVVSELSVNGVSLLSAVNDTTELPAKVRIQFKFSGLDKLVDLDHGRILYQDRASGAYEIWSFIYDETGLKLDGISQPTESSPHLVRSLAEFAKNNEMFYSPDWGRYALPTRGLIFSEASLKTADVNNHVIGKWGDCLVQLYTYSRAPAEPESYFLVGQINVPKTYDGVIVRAAKSGKKYTKIPSGYERFEMEWADFNQKYEVYASKRDALSAFELLNPKFMANLYDKNLNYSMEVVENVVYIFAEIEETKEEDYQELLMTLTEAFHELEH